MADSEILKNVIQSVVFGYGYRARSGKDTAAQTIKQERGDQYDIRLYSFAGELKREVTECADKSGGIRHLFDPGLYSEFGGYLQENGNILSLPEWVQYEPDADMTDPLCPYGKMRLLLQWWGTQYRRSVNPNYWVQRVAKRIAEEKPEIALITDVRFLNEVAFCQEYGEAIKIERPELPPLEGAAASHVSETELDSFKDWDDVVVNDGSLEEFRERVLFSFDMLLETRPLQRPASV